MSKDKLPSSIKVFGYALLILGFGLALWGYELYGSIDSQITVAFTGENSDKVMNVFIASGISFLIGLFISLRK